MPYETDERLKSFLDANQLHREQLCVAILAMDKRFSKFGLDTRVAVPMVVET